MPPKKVPRMEKNQTRLSFGNKTSDDASHSNEKEKKCTEKGPKSKEELDRWVIQVEESWSDARWRKLYGSKPMPSSK